MDTGRPLIVLRRGHVLKISKYRAALAAAYLQLALAGAMERSTVMMVVGVGGLPADALTTNKTLMALEAVRT